MDTFNKIYDSEKYYTRCKEEFVKEIKELKSKFSDKKYKELKCLLDFSLKNDNKYEFKIFLLFKFYYIIKTTDINLDIILIIFNNFKYLRNFYIIIDKNNNNLHKKLHLFKYVFEIIIFFDLNILCNNYDDPLNIIFFYNFFFINDLNKDIINNIQFNLSYYIKDKSILQKYIKPLDNILSWSIMREIWIYLCIFAQTKKTFIFVFILN